MKDVYLSPEDLEVVTPKPISKEQQRRLIIEQYYTKKKVKDLSIIKKYIPKKKGKKSKHIEKMEEEGHHIHEASASMWIPYGILAVLTIVIGIIGLFGVHR